ncbi:MAG TPA: ornithine cyclodeaminase family protein [Ramlibacter sp.]|nr:ornithine cyclodeaminase family protein [Ramlibacter sp.]
MKDVLYLREQDVVEAVGFDTAIAALQEMLRAQWRQEARNVPKTLATWGDGSAMHALGSLMPQRGYLGFKTWAHTPGGSAAIFTLFDAETGALLAIIEARALGQLRTSAMTGVATRLLARTDATTMALIGTGAQAMLQLAAVAAVRRLRSVRVYSPTATNRRAFVDRAASHFAIELVEVDTLEQAVDGADIVTLITRARAPFLHRQGLMQGAHVNAVGAILPSNAEFHQDVFDAADLVVVDDLENARRSSRELIERFGADESGWSGVRTLAQLVDQPPARAGGLSLYKGVGMGLSDLAVAIAAYERASAGGRGLRLPQPARVDPLQALTRAR